MIRFCLAQAAPIVLLCASCISLTNIQIGQKTSLERQLIGDFEPLTQDEVLAASVRARAGSGSLTLDALQQRAVAARRRQLFNRDDMIELKSWGCLGETFEAELARRDCAQAGAVEVTERLNRLLAQEAADRAAIVDWAIANDPALAPDDRSQVWRLYGRLLHEQARPGDWLRQQDGRWQRKPGR